MKGGWVSYRPEIKVLDCTVRDGGLMNNHNFEDRFVKAVYDTCVAAGVDYMELGYKGSKSIYLPTEHGPWKHCDEDVMRRIVGDNDSDLKLSVMADAERCDYHVDILPKDQSVLDLIRVATYIHQIPVALDMIKDARDKGYEVAVNLMAVSSIQERELDDGLEALAKSEAEIIYLVDSFGAYYSEQIKDLTNKYIRFAKEAGKEVGIHAHNNQQLGYANTIEAIIAGANYLDGTISGIGRGAGNCPIELLIGFLHNPRYRLRPIIKFIEEHVPKLGETMQWGFEIPYMITGQLNMHPRQAMQLLAGDQSDQYVQFYDSLLEEE